MDISVLKRMLHCNTTSGKTVPWYWFVIGLVGIFALNVFWITPWGFAGWLGYVVVTFVAGWWGNRWAPYLIAGCSTVMIGIGSFISPPGIAPYVAFDNRMLSVALLWLTAASFTASLHLWGQTSSPESITTGRMRSSVAAAILLPIAALVLMSGLLFWQLNELLEANQQVTHTDQVLQGGEHTVKLLVDMETGLRGYAIAGEEQFLLPFVEADHAIEQHFNRLGALVADNPSQVMRVEHIQKLVDQWRLFAHQLITVWQKSVEASSVYPLAEGKQRMDIIREQVAEFIHIERQLRDSRNQAAIDQARSLQLILLSTFLGLAVVIGLLVNRRINSIVATYGNALRTKEQSEEQLRALSQELEQRVVDRTQELRESEIRLRAMAVEANLAEQRERKRLATEMHDYLQQILVLGKLKAAQAKRLPDSVPTRTAMLSAIDDVFTDALKYTRTLVADLSPSVLQEFGLAAALGWLANDMKRYDMSVTVRTPEENGPVLPEAHTLLLFQSVRELLFNAMKHSGSLEAQVMLQCADHSLQLEVQDHGRGFDPSAITSSPEGSSKFGLFSIRERMQALGGTFELLSTPGKGTKAILTLPHVDASPSKSHSSQSDVMQCSTVSFPTKTL